MSAEPGSGGRRLIIDKNTGLSIGLFTVALGGVWFLTDIRFQVASMAKDLNRIGATLDDSATRREIDRLFIVLRDLNPDLALKLPPAIEQ
jgi:hypothetical protein